MKNGALALLTTPQSEGANVKRFLIGFFQGVALATALAALLSVPVGIVFGVVFLLLQVQSMELVIALLLLFMSIVVWYVAASAPEVPNE